MEQLKIKVNYHYILKLFQIQIKLKSIQVQL